MTLLLPLPLLIILSLRDTTLQFPEQNLPYTSNILLIIDRTLYFKHLHYVTVAYFNTIKTRRQSRLSRVEI